MKKIMVDSSSVQWWEKTSHLARMARATVEIPVPGGLYAVHLRREADGNILVEAAQFVDDQNRAEALNPAMFEVA